MAICRPAQLKKGGFRTLVKLTKLAPAGLFATADVASLLFLSLLTEMRHAWIIKFHSDHSPRKGEQVERVSEHRVLQIVIHLIGLSPHRLVVPVAENPEIVQV